MWHGEAVGDSRSTNKPLSPVQDCRERPAVSSLTVPPKQSLKRISVDAGVETASGKGTTLVVCSFFMVLIAPRDGQRHLQRIFHQK